MIGSFSMRKANPGNNANMQHVDRMMIFKVNIMQSYGTASYCILPYTNTMMLWGCCKVCYGVTFLTVQFW
jgi:hypothetical protein